LRIIELSFLKVVATIVTPHFYLSMHNNDLRKFFGSVDPALKLSIILPVKDEAECIVETLTALKDQIDPDGNEIDKSIYEVLVLVNNCSDSSYELCLQFKAQYPRLRLHICPITIPQEQAHIGTVRKLLMDEACSRLMSLGHKKGIIVSTDGDSQVDAKWIFYILHEMNKGVDVVSGRILPRDIPLASKWPHLRDVNYRFLVSRLEALIDPCPADPWPRHFQCYGPSIAVTCEMYNKVGGIKAIPFLEDEEFRKALKRVDAKIRKSPDVKIYTSSRLVGRVAFGFSVQLNQWQQMQSEGLEQYVEDFDSTFLKFKNKRLLRSLWVAFQGGDFESTQLQSIANSLHLDYQWLAVQMYSKQYFEHLWEEIELQLVTADHPKIKKTTISLAIAEFRNYFASHKRILVPVKTVKQPMFLKKVAV
jgi:glycosyltransferase involved in cell wall biosynthesis